MKPNLVVLFALGLAACSSLTPKPAAWTPELVSATQQNFKLLGEWNFIARSGSDFGRKCDMVFDADGTYRKSCNIPLEESGQWVEVGHWKDHTMRVHLRERVDLIRQKQLDPMTIDVVVESPNNDAATMDGDLYKRH